MHFGQVIRVLSKRIVDFDEIVVGNDVDAILVPKIPVVDLGMVVLQVRVHGNGISGDASIVVALEHTAPSEDEPDLDFVASTPAASVTIDAVTPKGALLIAFASTGVGSCLRLKATGVRRSGSETAAVELSADLVGRRGVPPGSRKAYTYTHHFYTKTNNGVRAYVPWATSSVSEVQNADDTFSIAPYDGRLVKVGLLSTAALADTAVAVYRGTGGVPGATAIESLTKSISANTVAEYVFTKSYFSREDTMQLSVDPTAATHGSLYITATWEWDPDT